MFEGKINKIILFFIYISVFVNSYVFTKEPAEIYLGYLIFFILLPVFVRRHPVPRGMMSIFLILLFAGLLNIYLGNNTFPQFLKIYLGLFFSYLFYYYVIAQSEFNIERLFQIYLYGCFIVCLIGIFQFVSFKVGFEPGYDFRWILNKWGLVLGGNLGIRINSIFGEPTYLATCVSAGMFVAIYNLIMKQPYYLTRLQSAVIVVAYLMSFSGVAYIAIFVMAIVLLLNFGFIRYLLIFIPVVFGIFTYLYNNVGEFRERYDSTVDIFSTGQFSIGKTHGSSIILYDNYTVAKNNFSKNFLLGSGLGSHPIAYEKHSITISHGVKGISNQNVADANSMFLRLVSETGLFGTVLMLVVFFGCFVKRDAEGELPERFWLISGGIFVMIFVNLFRQGHFFLNGFPFFVWMYYYNKMQFKEHIAALQEKEEQAADVPVLSSQS